MTPLFRKFLGLNWILFFTMAILLVVGIYAIYACTHGRTDNPGIMLMWRKQIQWAALGLLIHFTSSLVDYRWVRWGAVPAFMLGVAGLLAVQAFGIEIHHNKSWIALPGGQTVQPSQFALAAGIIMLAVVLGELHRVHHFFRYHFVRLIIAGIVVLIPLGFVLKEGDLGSALVWLPVFGAMLLAGNIPFRYLIVIALCGLMVLPLGFFFGLKEYQRQRIIVPVKMLRGIPVDYQREGYAPTNIVTAIGSAGYEGKGVDGVRMPLDENTNRRKKTMHQLGLIPKDTAHDDYIFAVFAEQHGFRGCLILLGIYAFMLFQCLYVAFSSRDQVGRLIVVGVVALLFAHLFENIGMQIQLTPITGIPLPFVSYGGTFLVTVMFLLGMVQSVWTHRNTALQEENSKPIPRGSMARSAAAA